MKTVWTLLGTLVFVLALGAPARGQFDFDPSIFKSSFVTPPLAGKEFLCQVVNLSTKPLSVAATIFDDGGNDISSAAGSPFVECGGAPIGPGVVCTVRGGSASREQATGAYCVISTFSLPGNKVRGSLQVFDLNGGGISAAVAAQ